MRESKYFGDRDYSGKKDNSAWSDKMRDLEQAHLDTEVVNEKRRENSINGRQTWQFRKFSWQQAIYREKRNFSSFLICDFLFPGPQIKPYILSYWLSLKTVFETISLKYQKLLYQWTLLYQSFKVRVGNTYQNENYMYPWPSNFTARDIYNSWA